MATIVNLHPTWAAWLHHSPTAAQRIVNPSTRMIRPCAAIEPETKTSLNEAGGRRITGPLQRHADTGRCLRSCDLARRRFGSVPDQDFPHLSMAVTNNQDAAEAVADVDGARSAHGRWASEAESST